MEKKVGRRSKYSDKLARKICSTIASTSCGLAKLCAMNPDWPCRDTIYAWMFENEEFSDMYARAKRMQVELLVDEIIDISDDNDRDTLIKQNKDGDDYEICNTEWINRSRLKVDSRKWLASKLAPRIYGDKITNEHIGKDGKPIEHTVTSTVTVYIPDNGRDDSN